MAKVRGPILSINARGQIGKSQVYAQWRGVPYARSYVIPSNPNTVAQQQVRGTFSWLSAAWMFAPASIAAAYTAAAAGRPFTNRNKWVQANLAALETEADLANMLLSPGAAGGLPVAGVVITPGETDFVVDITPPTLPVGWTIVSAQAACLPDQDPHGIFTPNYVAAEDLVAPYSITLPGLTASTQYLVGSWLVYEKPDGSFAYSIAEGALESTAAP